MWSPGLVCPGCDKMRPSNASKSMQGVGCNRHFHHPTTLPLLPQGHHHNHHTQPPYSPPSCAGIEPREGHCQDQAVGGRWLPRLKQGDHRCIHPLVYTQQLLTQHDSKWYSHWPCSWYSHWPCSFPWLVGSRKVENLVWLAVAIQAGVIDCGLEMHLLLQRARQHRLSWCSRSRITHSCPTTESIVRLYCGSDSASPTV